MSPIDIGWIVLACIVGGAPIGVVLRRILPEHHLSSDSKDVIKLAMGLTATMAALVLALLIASAKSSYDAQRNEVTQFVCALSVSGAIVLTLELDRPFGELVQISSTPMRNAVAYLGK